MKTKKSLTSTMKLSSRINSKWKFIFEKILEIKKTHAKRTHANDKTSPMKFFDLDLNLNLILPSRAINLKMQMKKKQK